MLKSVHILGASINLYGVTYVVAFLVALSLLARRARELDKPQRWVGEGVLVATAAGLVGTRLYHLIDHPSGWSNPFDWNGGNTWYGGLILGTVAVLAWGRWRRIPLTLALDSAGAILATLQAIGRIGCQLAGDGDYGIRSHLPWAMGYPHGTVPTPPGVRVHPTPVYETLMLGLIGLWLWRSRDSFRPGALFAWYLVLSGLERFLIELVRRNPAVVGGLTAAQVISLVCVAVGAGWLLWPRARGVVAARRAPAGVSPRPM